MTDIPSCMLGSGILTADDARKIADKSNKDFVDYFVMKADTRSRFIRNILAMIRWSLLKGSLRSLDTGLILRVLSMY